MQRMWNCLVCDIFPRTIEKMNKFEKKKIKGLKEGVFSSFLPLWEKTLCVIGLEVERLLCGHASPDEI